MSPGERNDVRGESRGCGLATGLALVVGVAVLSLSCQTTRGELVPFTEAQRLRYQLGETELRSLQYYLSDRVVLERTASDAAGKVERGRLIVRGGTAIHQVVVERGTPGAVEPSARIGAAGTGRHWLEVSFERGAPLRFAATTAGTYSLDGDSRGGFFFGWGKPPQVEVEFDGAKWTVVTGADSRLLIERDALGKLARTRRVLPGVRAPGSR